MHKLLNFICLPFFIAGLIFLSNGLLGYNSYEIYIESNTKTSSQINNLYSEKEITLKGPPVSEVLSDKIFVKIRNKPINPILISNIKIKNNTFENTYLSDTDFDYLNSNKKEFVKTVLPIIINENQKIIVTREFLNDLKIKLQTFKTINNNEISKLNKIAKKFNIKYSNKHKLDLIEEILANVDIIPNSIALAQAAIESGWGKSRFAKEYNALFGEYTYDQNKGVVPLEREHGDKHLIKSFTSYNNSVSSYFKNINSHNAYKEFRDVRNIMRSKNNFSNISLLLNKLNSYAEDNNYVSNLHLVIEKNNFNKFDSKIISY
jgi:Bax protein|tara:strand:- start:1277 stop:2233 length:957 start_codon:yes stop_codon:yes gene_type:complete